MRHFGAPAVTRVIIFPPPPRKSRSRTHNPLGGSHEPATNNDSYPVIVVFSVVFVLHSTSLTTPSLFATMSDEDHDYAIESADAGASATIPMEAGQIKKGG